METQKLNKGFAHWVRQSTTARMLMIGFIILVLLVPLLFIKDLIRERSLRQQDVVTEVSGLWGKEILFMGPILKIPYNTYQESTKIIKDAKKVITERTKKINYAYFFPSTLAIDANVDAVKKDRGLYETSVFTSEMNFKGAFEMPDFGSKDISADDVLWDKASILMKTSNLKGIKNQITMQFGERPLVFLPKYQENNKDIYGVDELVLHELHSGTIKGFTSSTTQLSFTTQMTVNGSQKIRFVPIGEKTTLTMESNWGDPSFTGSFLPEENGQENVTPKGFKAHWKVLQINRQFEQAFFGHLPDLREFSFGTELLVPVDEYQKSERSAKYGYLVITLTFLVFFLIQTISTIQIHPFQYLMIGLALVMFYTLLISISEHQNFLKAYTIASVSVVGLISLYSRSILKNRKFVVLVFTSLTALYLFIFVIIQLESYALLVGSIGLFAILATVMFASRKIDWNQS
ncbi:Inner membrane protein [Croceitalea dokdonensis DOKDO 023]|uniref:Inner membrane protein n=1 Tax=Croceitalea dokdonensis DOKDO 023 TaxID=1300341 RepID=A0A0P7AW84_9FLAO|nr:cell envelope integrity protein CreD [Croceitalea dokdonensis]KPM30603.1 Inner membrane protein [Croceitalea dokdonensis DOKDO 023]